MLLNTLGGNTCRLLERAMDGSALRSQLLAHNISNVNTPGYKRLDLDFASVLEATVAEQSAVTLPLATTNRFHLAGTQSGPGQLRVYQENATSSRNDGNNVDVEFERVQVAENSLFFKSLADSWRKEMSGLKMAIEGRT